MEAHGESHAGRPSRFWRNQPLNDPIPRLLRMSFRSSPPQRHHRGLVRLFSPPKYQHGPLGFRSRGSKTRPIPRRFSGEVRWCGAWLRESEHDAGVELQLPASRDANL